jgi:hypothetical protein
MPQPLSQGTRKPSYTPFSFSNKSIVVDFSFLYRNTAIRQIHAIATSYATNPVLSHCVIIAAKPRRSGIVLAIRRLFPWYAKMSWYQPIAIDPMPVYTISFHVIPRSRVFFFCEFRVVKIYVPIDCRALLGAPAYMSPANAAYSAGSTKL